MSIVVTFRLPEKLNEEVKDLIKNKIYTSRSEFLQIAVRDLLRKEAYRKQRNKNKSPKEDPNQRKLEVTA